jgi:hypothetical protein
MQDTTIRVLFGVVNVPAGVLKVFTSNLSFKESLLKQPKDEIPFNQYQIQAILRRVSIVNMETTFFQKTLSVLVPPAPCTVTENGTRVDTQYQKGFAKVELKPAPAKLDPAGCGLKGKNLTESEEDTLSVIKMLEERSSSSFFDGEESDAEDCINTEITLAGTETTDGKLLESKKPITKRPRGRPRKTELASVETTVTKRPRGRPRKTELSRGQAAVPKPKRRPAKGRIECETTKRPRGRPPKAAML